MRKIKKCLDCENDLSDLRTTRCKSCYGKFITGRTLSPEHIFNLKKALVGRKLSPEHAKKISESNKGRIHSDKTKKKISQSLKGKRVSPNSEFKKGHIPLVKGENHPNWNGGSSFEPYGLKFNNQLKEKIRDKYGRKCIECGYYERELKYKLHIHHIDYNKQNNSEDNLISLCRSCHLQTNFKREDWTNYFKQKQGMEQ